MNLIVCTTPLQVLIAERVMELYPNEEFYGVMITPFNNEKYKHYYQRLSEKVNCSMYINIYKSFYCKGIIKIIELFKLKKKIVAGLRHQSFSTVFLANIENIEVQLFLSCICFNKVNTFDDGTSNIMKTSFLYQDSIHNLKNRIGRSVLGIKYYTEDLRSMTILHYTLYENQKNLIENIKTIDLLGKNAVVKNIISTNFVGEKSIFLSQPIYESDILNKELFETLYKKYKFDYYFPHPRENYEYEHSKKIDTHLVFEDYICNLINTNGNIKYTIYTYFSSAILNIKNLGQIISVVAIKPDSKAFKEYDQIYDFLSEQGIVIENIECGD